MKADIETLEKRTFRAWPALEMHERCGWQLRFADGYTRRSNSVNPIAFTGRAAQMDSLIAECESLYAERALPTVFKLTPISQPSDLDAILAGRGYALQSGAMVLACDLATRQFDPAANAHIYTQLEEGWLADFARMNGLSVGLLPVMRKLLNAIEPPRAFMQLEQDGRVVAVGLAVAEAGYVGLFDIVVDSGSRRRGLGRALVQSLLAWGQREGAHTAYLQVVRENLAARALYESLGFEFQYEYVYRVKADIMG